MNKILSIRSTSPQQIDFNTDTSVLELGSRLQKEVRNADTPITGALKDSLQKLMLFNIEPFEIANDLKNVPEIQIDASRIRDLFARESITYREFIGAIFTLVEHAEAILINIYPPEREIYFSSEKSPEDQVKDICKDFPKMCRIPLFRPKGLFSFELLWKPVVDAILKDNQVDCIVWPFAMCTELGEADKTTVGPSSMGRHDRGHLGLLNWFLKELSEEEKVPFIPLNMAVTSIKTCLAETKDKEELRHLSMLLTYGLHEDIRGFLKTLHVNYEKNREKDFLGRILTVLGKDAQIDKKTLKKMVKELRALCNPGVERQKSKRFFCN